VAKEQAYDMVSDLGRPSSRRLTCRKGNPRIVHPRNPYQTIKSNSWKGKGKAIRRRKGI